MSFGRVKGEVGSPGDHQASGPHQNPSLSLAGCIRGAMQPNNSSHPIGQQATAPCQSSAWEFVVATLKTCEITAL
eukprot:364928-Chlamydomonas_euryale.AAC.2